MRPHFARLNDGSTLEIAIEGEGPSLLVPVDSKPAEGPQAEELRQQGADPSPGHSLVQGLRDAFRVVTFDYIGHLFAKPRPDTLTPATIAVDFLAVADAAGARRFAYYGYSWLGMAGMQLALSTDRLTALVMGGCPPIAGPWREMRRVIEIAHARSDAAVQLSKDQTRQYLTLYASLQGFDGRAAIDSIKCPCLCFVGSKDVFDYDASWDHVRIDVAGPVIRHREELAKRGWDVRILDGLDHAQARQTGRVVPILRSWLA